MTCARVLPWNDREAANGVLVVELYLAYSAEADITGLPPI